MLLPLTLLLLLAGPPRGAPPPAETAKLYFLAGDLARAQEYARQGVKRDPKRCKPLVRQLAEYAWLAGRADELVPKEARTLLELDRAISPQKPGRLTERIIERFVTRPLQIAAHHAAQDHADSARVIARQVLEVDPSNQQALSLAAAPPDAGQLSP